MNEPGHNELLLSEVLSEGISAEFREGLLNQTLRLARRGRRFRQARRATTALAVVVGLGLLVVHRFPSNLRPTGFAAKPYTIVRTHSLPPAAWVATRPFSPVNLVASVQTGHIVATAKAGVQVRELNDDELLALAPKPAALVRFGPHSVELVLVNLARQVQAE
ncbi:MAG: hypothetical protein ACLQU3_29550 [Limisphaerales bacterium]